MCAVSLFSDGQSQGPEETAKVWEGVVFETKRFRREVRVQREHGSCLCGSCSGSRSEKVKKFLTVFGLRDIGDNY